MVIKFNQAGRVTQVYGRVLGVIGRSGRQLKQFSGVHQLACPSEYEATSD